MGPEIGVLHIYDAKKALNSLKSHRILTCVKLRTMNVNSSTLCKKEASHQDVNRLIVQRSSASYRSRHAVWRG